MSQEKGEFQKLLSIGQVRIAHAGQLTPAKRNAALRQRLSWQCDAVGRRHQLKVHFANLFLKFCGQRLEKQQKTVCKLCLQFRLAIQVVLYLAFFPYCNILHVKSLWKTTKLFHSGSGYGGFYLRYLLYLMSARLWRSVGVWLGCRFNQCVCVTKAVEGFPVVRGLAQGLFCPHSFVIMLEISA